MSDIQFVGAPKRTPFRRILRAAMRDTSALWSEFRRPILMFVLATLGGGWLYGELLVFAGYPRVPFIDLPYMMVLLMVLESFADIPPEPYLVIFWYGMPLIALYVIGQGVTDFVRLFFNRGERRNAWEEAVASTYRNHIIVMGIGHVGSRVLRALAQMGSEVIAIDIDVDKTRIEELRSMHIPLILGDGRDKETLEKAGIYFAQSFIICTSNDFLNLEVGVRAREMNATMRLVVRMWDSQFANHLKNSLNAETISASDLAAPAFAGMALGAEIAHLLDIQNTAYSLIRLKIEPGSFMDGQTIHDLEEENDMDIVLFEGSSQVDVHPAGHQPVHAGDTLVIFARHAQIMQIVARNRGRS